MGRGFGASVAAFAAASGRDIETVHRQVSLRLFSAVIKNTPVLTGRLRANWLCTLHEPSTVTTSDEGSVNVTGMKMTIKRHQPGDSLFLANNLPYAARIEFDGYSAKAPRGMVRINVVRFKLLLREEIRNLRRGNR